jgi:hypothetical protein
MKTTLGARATGAVAAPAMLAPRPRAAAPSSSSASSSRGRLLVSNVAVPSRPPTSHKARRSKVEIIKEQSDYLRHPLMEVRLCVCCESERRRNQGGNFFCLGRPPPLPRFRSARARPARAAGSLCTAADPPSDETLATRRIGRAGVGPTIAGARKGRQTALSRPPGRSDRVSSPLNPHSTKPTNQPQELVNDNNFISEEAMQLMKFHGSYMQVRPKPRRTASAAAPKARARAPRLLGHAPPSPTPTQKNPTKKTPPPAPPPPLTQHNRTNASAALLVRENNISS